MLPFDPRWETWCSNKKEDFNLDGATDPRSPAMVRLAPKERIKSRHPNGGVIIFTELASGTIAIWEKILHQEVSFNQPRSTICFDYSLSPSILYQLLFNNFSNSSFANPMLFC